MRPPAWETVMRMPYFKQIDTIKRMSEIVTSGEADAMSFVMKNQWNYDYCIQIQSMEQSNREIREMRNKLQGVRIYTNLHAETDELYKLIYAQGSKNQIIAISQEIVKDTQNMIKAFIQRLLPPKPDENPCPAYYYLRITDFQMFVLHFHLERIIQRQLRVYQICYNPTSTIEQQMNIINTLERKYPRDTIKFRFRARMGPYPKGIKYFVKKK